MERKAVRNSDSLSVQLRHPDDAARAAQVLESLATALHTVDADTGDVLPIWVSPAITMPDGPVIQIDAGKWLDDQAREIPVRIVEHLEAHGVTSGTLDTPKRDFGPLGEVRYASNVVALYLYPDAAREEFFQAAIDAAGQWLGDHDLEAGSRHDRWGWLGFGGRVSAAEGETMMRVGVSAGTWGMFLCGRVPEQFRVASFFADRYGSFALLGGGDSAEPGPLATAFDVLCQTAVELAELTSYSFVTVEPEWSVAGEYGFWSEDERGVKDWWCRRAPNLLAVDAFPFQILGPRHLSRLASPPEGLETVAKNRHALRLGRFDEWRPGTGDRHRTLELARGTLRGLLVDNDSARDIVREHKRQTRGGSRA